MKSFIKAFKNNIRFTYPRYTGQDIRLGYYGIIKNDGFQYIGSVSGLDLSFKVTRETLSDKITFNRNANVSLLGEAGGNLNNVTGTELKIDFTQADSYYFSSYICENERIDNPRVSLEQGLVNLLNSRRKQWNEDWVVVTALKKSKNTVWIYSKNNGSNVIVNCDAKGISLGDIVSLEKAKFSFSSNNSGLTTFVTDSDDESVIGFELMKLTKECLNPHFKGEGNGDYFTDDVSRKLSIYE